MRYKTPLIVAFTAVAGFALLKQACSSMIKAGNEARLEEQARDAATVAQLEISDREAFKKAGFDVVWRTGMGGCWADGTNSAQGNYGANTDLTYVLSKPGQPFTYTACMRHSKGRGSMTGLKAVDVPAR